MKHNISNIFGKLKRYLPIISNIANGTLNLIEKELNDSSVKTHVRKSSNKIFIDIDLPGIDKDDVEVVCNKNNLSIGIKNPK